MTNSQTKEHSPVNSKTLDNILLAFAQDLMDYDQRMTEANAPNIRFVHKYNNRARRAILKWHNSLITEEKEKAVKLAYEEWHGNTGM